MWHQPCRGDWTETVQQNLGEFGIATNFEFMRSKSSEAFKHLVKVKAQEYALKELIKSQGSPSKMENLHYSSLKLQKYMKNMRIDQVRNIFRYRTNMARFGKNYRGKEDFIMCPLCSKHFDSQELSFQCEFFKDKMNINCNMSDVNSENVSQETAKVITDMMRLREKFLEEKSCDN